ncbi:MAG: lysine--tRNA ligase, partial [Chloroflexi bacterium]|nr:lysine--tRNA ligase [Chloroflexota bacterium]
MQLRTMGKLSFAQIEDVTGKIQLFIRSNVLGDEAYARIKELDIGDIVGARGPMMRTKTGEISVEVRELVLLAKSLRPLPGTWYGLSDTEKRYRQRYLDLIVNEEVRQLFLLRSKVIGSVRRFLDERGFVEVETPALQPIYGGAAARPFVTHHNALDRQLFLRIATELYLKRLIVGGLEKVYE